MDFRSKLIALAALAAGVACGPGDPPAPAAPPCTPETCASLSAQCGDVPDGCGKALECGGCPQGETCGGGGLANVCGAPPPPPCQPKTCTSAGASCGSMPDGCGGTLQCGTCPPGQTCGANHVCDGS